MSVGSAPTLLNTCAIIVTYFPDFAFRDRLQRVLTQFPFAIIVDNGSQGVSADMLHDLQSLSRLDLVANTTNLGIAAALNQGIQLALKRGYAWVVTLDQDTIVYPDLLQTLIEVHRECRNDHMIVGGNYRDMHRQKDFIQCRRSHQHYVERKTLITSGTMASLRLMTDLGGFREDYFIDSVDHEFCLRARAHGCKVVMSCRPVMSHSIGAPIEQSGWVAKFSSFNHSPTRKYFIARNTVATAKNYFLREPAWSLRQLWRLAFDFASLLLFEQGKRGKARAFLIGIVHGLTGKMGPIDNTLIHP